MPRNLNGGEMCKVVTLYQDYLKLCEQTNTSKETCQPVAIARFLRSRVEDNVNLKIYRGITYILDHVHQGWGAEKAYISTHPVMKR